MKRIKILVVDDLAKWRSLMRVLLEANSDFQVVAEASNGYEAIEKRNYILM